MTLLLIMVQSFLFSFLKFFPVILFGQIDLFIIVDTTSPSTRKFKATSKNCFFYDLNPRLAPPIRKRILPRGEGVNVIFRGGLNISNVFLLSGKGLPYLYYHIDYKTIVKGMPLFIKSNRNKNAKLLNLFNVKCVKFCKFIII